MMSCLSASRGYPQRTTRLGIKSLASSCPPTQPQPQPQTSQSACSSAVSDGKCSISSSETSSSPVVLTKKPRSRRRRPHEIYNEAAAALSAVYPKIFSCPPNKQRRQQQQNNSNSTAIAVKKSKPSLYADDDSELLQEVPTFVRRARDMELLLFCNQSGAEAEAKSKSTDFQRQVPDNSLAHSPTPSSDAKSQSQSQSEIVAMSPSCVDYCCDWDDSSTVEYDCLLDSSEDAIDVGIMSAIMGDSGEASSSSADNGGVVPDAVAVAVVAGEAAAAQQRLQCSAIRSLRRMSDCMSAPLSDFHGCSRLRILDRVMADRYKNSSSSSSSKSMMSLCSLDWLKAEVAAAPRRLKLKLNYEDVLNAWSDRGPLFADDSAASPHFGFEDSAFGSMAAAGYGYDWVPDMSFWRSVGENGMYVQMDDRACCGEDGMLPGSGVREASVLRYKEKRRTRLFSKKIRYEVRKLNAERRPRMKGRFVRRLSDI